LDTVFRVKYRTIPQGNVRVSEVGFGMWTVSTGWWGKFTESEAMALMHKAFDLGITLFDAADTYGNGYSEELLAKAFPNRRDDITIATKIGYDFYNFGAERKGQREIPQDFSPKFLRFATEESLKRLNTDRIDVLQLHNLRMEQVRDDKVWETLESLKSEGKVRCYGAALGPAIGWLYEGVDCAQKRKPAVMQIIYNMLEQYPGNEQIAAARGTDTRFFIRVPHSSGMLEGKFTPETTFPPDDHRWHRPRSWLINGLKKIETLKFLTENTGRTLGQAALKWLLAEPLIATTLPNIYNEEQLCEFAAAPDTPDFSAEELRRVAELYAENFGVKESPMNYKGTMIRKPEPSRPVTAEKGGFTPTFSPFSSGL
jgi:aryl-alcohol dehydrogenase-like predicted oxidoreductase